MLVGICMQRSIEMIIGLLAVLKAGGAYVPLDPSYPKERLAFMMQDAYVSVLLTQQRVHEQVFLSASHSDCLGRGVGRDWPLQPDQNPMRQCLRRTWLISFIPQAQQVCPKESS